MLTAWDHEVYGTSAIFRDAMERILDISFWGHEREGDFGPVFGKDQELFEALRKFVLDARWLGTPSQRIMERAILEVGRFSNYKDTTNYERLPLMVDSIRNRYAGGEHRKTVWLRLVSEIDYNDGTNCSRYGLCGWYRDRGFESSFRNELFSERRACPANFCSGDTVTLHAQGLGSDELDLACRRLRSHGEVFHSMFSTQCRPVADDLNEHLDIFVFTDGASCEDMEWAAFPGGDTCSGIYFESEPSDSSTTPLFVVTEKEPGDRLIDPELAIWNFEHEYAHYLDGRYNRHGGFLDDPALHGWSEGFAEYFASEVSLYHRRAYCTSSHSLTDTLLLSGSIPTSYGQRHLVLRFLMEMQRAFVDGMLPLLRRGDFEQSKRYTEREAPNLEAAWESWLEAGCREGRDRAPTFGSAKIANLSVGVDKPVSLVLPSAEGGDEPLIYELVPALPAGLGFDPATRRLSGRAPWPSPQTDFTYIATDGDLVDPDAVGLTFAISVLENTTQPPPPPVIDPDAANVTAVAIGSTPGSDSTYAGGDAIDVTLTFDRNVIVDATNGTPSILLAVGTRPREAFYTRGSGSSELTFSYTVVAGGDAFFVAIFQLLGRPAPPVGDEDGDGVSLAEGIITMNGGAVEDSTARAVNVPHPELTTLSEHKVDGIWPYMRGTSSFVDGAALTVAFTEALDPSAPDAAGFVVEIAGGERCLSAAAIDISGSTVALALAAAVGPGEQVVLSYKPSATPLRDLVGNAALEDRVPVTNRTTTGAGGNGGACGATPPGPDDGGGGGGGGPPPPSGDEDDEDDDGGGGGGGGSVLPPRASIALSAECGEDLCRARTDVPVSFEDASSGSVRFRTWDLGDGTTSRRQTVEHAWSEPGFYEVTLRVSNGTSESVASRTFLVEASTPAGTCEADAETRCLRDSRYEVRADWWNAEGETGAARVAHSGTNDSGLFWFFVADNWEVLIKVLDGCALNGNVWVFGASTTDLGYRIAVTDTRTGAVKEYTNEPGLPAPAIADTTAFPGDCQP